MDLRPINPANPVFYATCAGCECRAPSYLPNGDPFLFADLDGEPFQAYFCADCAAKMRASALATAKGD